MRRFHTLLSITFLLFFWPITNSSAQINPSGMSGGVVQPLSIKLSPEYPAPGERITVSLDDYSVNTTGSTIRWSYALAGQDSQTLDDERSITITAPPIGEAATLSVTLTNPQGQTMQASRTILSHYLDVIVEPNTYSPPFYRGRTLPIYGSDVRLTALLHTEDGLVNPSNHTYTWRLNNQVIDGGGIRGKFQTTITVPYGDNQLVGVEVTNQQGRLVSKRNVLVPVGEIDINFYENHPLYGLGKRAISNNYNLISESATIMAIPYNLDLHSIQRGLVTDWRINGQRTETNSNPFEITLRREGNGSAAVAFTIRNSIDRLQAADAAVTVNF